MQSQTVRHTQRWSCMPKLKLWLAIKTLFIGHEPLGENFDVSFLKVLTLWLSYTFMNTCMHTVVFSYLHTNFTIVHLKWWWATLCFLLSAGLRGNTDFFLKHICEFRNILVYSKVHCLYHRQENAPFCFLFFYKTFFCLSWKTALCLVSKDTFSWALYFKIKYLRSILSLNDGLIDRWSYTC